MIGSLSTVQGRARQLVTFLLKLLTRQVHGPHSNMNTGGGPPMAPRPTALCILQQTRPLCQPMTVKQTEAFLRHQLEKDQERHASNDPTEQPILRFKLEDIGRQSDDDDKSDDDIDGDAETYNCDHDLDRTNDDLARGSLEGVEDAEGGVREDAAGGEELEEEAHL